MASAHQEELNRTKTEAGVELMGFSPIQSPAFRFEIGERKGGVESVNEDRARRRNCSVESKPSRANNGDSLLVAIPRGVGDIFSF